MGFHTSLSFGEIFKTVGISRGHYVDRLLESSGGWKFQTVYSPLFLFKNNNVALSRTHPINF